MENRKRRISVDGRRIGKTWGFIAGLNLYLGIMLWIGYCTDYSWAGSIADYCFAPGVALVAVASLMWIWKGTTNRARHLCRLACMPSLIGGGMALLLMVVMLCPPFTLGFIFALQEINSEKHIQSAPSPNNSLVANVYFRGVGAYASGRGRTEIRVRHRWLPLLERDLSNVSRSYADDNDSDYLYWRDNNTLVITGEPSMNTHIDREFEVGLVHYTIPIIFTMPFHVMRSIVYAFTQ